MAVTDDERREVAERLRETKAECEERGYPWMCDDLILALGYDHDYEAGDEIFDRLADLIEPSCDRDTPQKVAEVLRFRAADVEFVPKPTCDRDALLALADEMEFDGAGALDDEDWCKPLLVEYARRIREACGERAS